MTNNFPVKIDETGRIVIPKEIRNSFNLHSGNKLCISNNEESITLNKINYIVTIDSFGRILIPKKIRNQYDIINNSQILLSITSNSITIQSNNIKHKKLVEKLIFLERKHNIYSILFDNNRYVYVSEKYEKAKQIKAKELENWLQNLNVKYKKKTILLKDDKKIILIMICETKEDKVLELISVLI